MIFIFASIGALLITLGFIVGVLAPAAHMGFIALAGFAGAYFLSRHAHHRRCRELSTLLDAHNERIQDLISKGVLS